jgi:hypothetical protein
MDDPCSGTALWSLYQDVVTAAASTRRLEAEGLGHSKQIVEWCVEGSPASIRAHVPVGSSAQNLETSTSLAVMNSSSAGWPRSVASMPRLIAGMISAGSVIRSP